MKRQDGDRNKSLKKVAIKAIFVTMLILLIVTFIIGLQFYLLSYLRSWIPLLHTQYLR